MTPTLSTPIVMEIVTDPVELEAARKLRAQADLNWKWFQEHAIEIGISWTQFRLALTSAYDGGYRPRLCVPATILFEQHRLRCELIDAQQPKISAHRPDRRKIA